jgi:hypothetical protein
MKTIISAGELLVTVKNQVFPPGWWRLTAAFLSGMVLTAVAAPTLMFLSELPNREVIAPVPGNNPVYYDPGISPDKKPAVKQGTELVYAFSEEASYSS